MSFFSFFPMMNFGEGLLDRTRCGVYFWKCYFSREFVIFSQERREEGGVNVNFTIRVVKICKNDLAEPGSRRGETIVEMI